MQHYSESCYLNTHHKAKWLILLSQWIRVNALCVTSIKKNKAAGMTWVLDLLNKPLSRICNLLCISRKSERNKNASPECTNNKQCRCTSCSFCTAVEQRRPAITQSHPNLASLKPATRARVLFADDQILISIQRCSVQLRNAANCPELLKCISALLWESFLALVSSEYVIFSFGNYSRRCWIIIIITTGRKPGVLPFSKVGIIVAQWRTFVQRSDKTSNTSKIDWKW